MLHRMYAQSSAAGTGDENPNSGAGAVIDTTRCELPIVIAAEPTERNVCRVMRLHT